MGEPVDVLLTTFERVWKYPLFTSDSGALTPGMIVTGVFGMLVVVAIAGVVRTLVTRRLLTHTNLSPGSQFAVGRLFYYMLLVIGGLVVLDTLGLKLSSLAFFGGLLGVGIGFGLQNIAANFISGLILLFERPVRVGDIVTLEDGTVGNIEEISMRVTLVRTTDSVMIYVPNSKLIENSVVNWSAGEPMIRVHVSVGTSYDSNPDHVRDVLLRVADSHERVLKNPAPSVLFTDFGDSSLDFELLVWVPDPRPEYRNALPSELRFEIFRAFEAEGIEIPFPQQDIHLRSGDGTITIDRPRGG
jgi:small-conductance mechanosensitive channel